MKNGPWKIRSRIWNKNSRRNLRKSSTRSWKILRGNLWFLPNLNFHIFFWYLCFICTLANENWINWSLSKTRKLFDWSKKSKIIKHSQKLFYSFPNCQFPLWPCSDHGFQMYCLFSSVPTKLFTNFDILWIPVSLLIFSTKLFIFNSWIWWPYSVQCITAHVLSVVFVIRIQIMNKWVPTSLFNSQNILMQGRHKISSFLRRQLSIKKRNSKNYFRSGLSFFLDRAKSSP